MPNPTFGESVKNPPIVNTTVPSVERLRDSADEGSGGGGAGSAGAQGAQGASGSGAQGAQGTQGAQGASGSGAQGPQGPQGEAGGGDYTTPVDGDFTWVNQSLATIDATYGFLHLAVPTEGGSGHRIRARVKTAPTAPYSVTVALRFRQDSGGTTWWGGVCFRESATGKIAELAMFRDQSINVNYYNAPTSFNSQPTTISPTRVPPVLWFRLTDDGTTLTYSYSTTGFYFATVWSTARTAFFTTAPDQIGFFGNITDADAVDLHVDVLSWVEA
jgi:hypothetical protein